MTITAAKKDLLTIVSRTLSVAASKSTMPILANVMLKAGNGIITASATNLGIGIASSCAAEGDIAVCVGAKDLAERLKALSDGPITLSLDGDALIVKGSGARRYKMPTIDVHHFPVLPEPPVGAPTWAVDSATLLALFSRTSFAVSTDETRAHLNSLLLEREGGTLRAVATDGHRLALAEGAVPGEGTASILVPLSAVRELGKLAEAGGSMDITLSERTMFVHAAAASMSLQLTDATFPPYQQVIPTTSTTRITVARAPLADAVRAVLLASPERTGIVRLDIDARTIRVSAADPGRGDASDEVPIERETGKGKIAIGFSGKYLLDALGAESTDMATIELSGDLDPIKLTSDGGRGCQIVMPARI